MMGVMLNASPHVEEECRGLVIILNVATYVCHVGVVVIISYF